MSGERWVAILAPIPKSSEFYNHIVGNIAATADAPKRDFANYVSGFSAKNRPTFKTKVEKSKDKVAAFAGVESNWSPGKKANSNDKFMFNSRGTDERYAVMHFGFRAKTSRNSLATSGGSGPRDPAYISSEDQGGIDARNVEELVADKNKAIVIAALSKLFLESLEKSQK